jgi:ribosomal subunit interface protein
VVSVFFVAELVHPLISAIIFLERSFDISTVKELFLQEGGTMQINVEGRNTDVQESWRQLIEGKLAKCERYTNAITHARVTITHSSHHQQGDNQVQVVLSLAGRTLTVKKHGAQIAAALRSALLVVEREVGGYYRNRKRFVKTPSPATEREDVGLLSSVFSPAPSPPARKLRTR